MPKFFQIPIFLFTAFALSGQTSLSGVLNTYAKVNTLDPCTGAVDVQGSVPFSAGDPVILIQMQGAQINSSNSAGFGEVTELGSAGFYEINEVKSVSGNTVFLKNTLLQTYDPAGSVQLVSFPVYEDATVSAPLAAQAWNGETGGLLAFQVTDSLVFQANVDVSGKGFRGGGVAVASSDCNFLTNADAYHYPTGNWRGAPKGEGIAKPVFGKEYGRGAQANGGGGGNDHNAGGGGGANAGTGGPGGRQNGPFLGCEGNYPGIGGKPGLSTADRVFLGGGGGAGHVDDQGAGSNGGNGGGIVIVFAKNLITNGFKISANGETPGLAGGDGAGGGGAGGTVLLKSTALVGNLAIETAGGGGGNVQNPTDRCFGAGGGGGGGLIRTNAPTAQLAVSLTGGPAGENTTASSECASASNGAENGAPGTLGGWAEVPQSTEAFLATTILQQPENQSVCEGDTVFFSCPVQGNFLLFQWQVNTGNGWANLPANAQALGTQSQNLAIAAPTPLLSGNHYRCLISSPCHADLASDPASLEVSALPVASFTATLTAPNTYLFENQSLAGIAYEWDFGDGTTTAEQSPVHEFPADGSYWVSLTASNSCGESVFTFPILVEQVPLVDFSAGQELGCAPLSVPFQNLSVGSNITGYEWSFPGGTPANSTEENPMVTYPQPGVFDVKLTVTTPNGNYELAEQQLITVEESPAAAFSFLANGLTVSFLNQSVGGSSFHWDFGDGTTSNEENPEHSYAAPGMYDVVLSAMNPACASSILQQINLTTSGISDDPKAIIQFYPNPASEILTIAWGPILSQPGRILLRHADGRLAKMAGTYQEAPCQVFVGDLPSGFYFLELEFAGQVFRYQLAKR